MVRSTAIQRKRTVRAIVLKNIHKRKRIMNEILNATEYVSEDAHIEYFQS